MFHDEPRIGQTFRFRCTNIIGRHDVQQIGPGRSRDQTHRKGRQYDARENQMAQRIHRFRRISLDQAVYHV